MNDLYSSDIEKYITEDHQNKIDAYKNKIAEILNAIPEHYKNSDKVYFKKYFKTIPSKIVCQRYKSAKKYHGIYYLFPTLQLAITYYCELQYESFHLISGIIDEVLPNVLRDGFNKFFDIKDISLGDTNKKDINVDIEDTKYRIYRNNIKSQFHGKE